MTTDELYMHRCIQLALNGMQNASPNPMVGAVVVCDGRIIGEGYHVRCGEGHAEVNAIASVKSDDEHLLPESTIYVSLEPCAHYGKTPPCANLIVGKRIKRCVIGCVDPFSKVSGKGIAILQDAGVEVVVGVLERECQDLNKRFITFHTLHRPFITLKWAQTSEGFIAPTNHTKGKPLIISNPLTATLCHKRRAEHQAIIIGRRTLEADNPSLNIRHWSGKSPLPVIIGDKEKLMSTNLKLLEGDSNVLFYPSAIESVKSLYAAGIQSALVEGGRQTLQSFIDSGLWDEAYIETSPVSIHEGIPSPVITNAQKCGSTNYAGNTVIKYTNCNPTPL